MASHEVAAVTCDVLSEGIACILRINADWVFGTDLQVFQTSNFLDSMSSHVQVARLGQMLHSS
jgi:hypothetical protein